MTREELVYVLRDYAKMTEEPPTGRAIEGQEEIMRCAADMIERSVEFDRVLEIVDRYIVKDPYACNPDDNTANHRLMGVYKEVVALKGDKHDED